MLHRSGSTRTTSAPLFGQDPGYPTAKERRLSTFCHSKGSAAHRRGTLAGRMSQRPRQTKLRTSCAGRIIAGDPFFRFSRMMSPPQAGRGLPAGSSPVHPGSSIPIRSRRPARRGVRVS
ncbi:hypothetical protein KM043_002768 [Ampulex compressa]|nr:hypothetical protein KM043_002768 [Ampulex compressa]